MSSPTETLNESAEAIADLLTDISDPVTPDAPASVDTPKWQVERETHGQEHVMQLIGNLTSDAQVTVPTDGKKPYVWGNIAVNRGEGQDSGFHTYIIYGVRAFGSDDESTRPSVEELTALGAQLSKGTADKYPRVKLQGKADFRMNNKELHASLAQRLGLDEAAAKKDPALQAFFFSGKSQIKLFVTKEQLNLASTYDDATTRRPITLVPHIGDGSFTKNNPKDIFGM